MLSIMDRRSRAQWQAAAARKRQWYQRPVGSPPVKRSLSVVGDVVFGHKWLIYWARIGKPFDPFWWS